MNYSPSMHEHLPEYLRPYVPENQVPVSFHFRGVEYYYWVVSTKLREKAPPGLPENFVMCIAQPDAKPHLLGISEAYIEDYRELAIIHEVVEHGMTDMFVEDSTKMRKCAEAFNLELFLAQKKFPVFADIKVYVQYRRLFFHNMVHWLERKQRGLTEQRQLEQLSKTLRVLNDIVGVI